jgi:hypothetical protein
MYSRSRVKGPQRRVDVDEILSKVLDGYELHAPETLSRRKEPKVPTV